VSPRSLCRIAIAVLGWLVVSGVAQAESESLSANLLWPRIVNGTLTTTHPEVGALLRYRDSRHSSFAGLCSGTLIGCQTFLTAAHCVCPVEADDAAACLQQGLIAVSHLEVFFQRVGFVPVAEAVIHPEYEFGSGGDLAVVKLAAPVSGITPSAINTVSRLPYGTQARIVGFGSTAAGFRHTNDSGVKRSGRVSTAACIDVIPDAPHLCWVFEGIDANTCEGDSGGPLFAELGLDTVLAGVTSGGESSNCLSEQSFDTDVFVYREWISATVGPDLGSSACGETGAMGAGAPQLFETTGQLTALTPDATLEVTVPDAARLLRATLNGQLATGTGLDRTENDFDLDVHRASNRDDLSECADENSTTFGACELAAPASGTWRISVHRVKGMGTFQLTVTVLPGLAACVGDCDNDGSVTVDDILLGVRIALGNAATTACPALDVDSSATVTVDEILAAVANALDDCSAS